MNAISPKFRGRRGFSLVELLVVIAVIAIIAAVAIPNIVNVTDRARYAKNQRNAQTVVSVATAALAAGFQPGTEWNTRSNIITSLMSGTVIAHQGGSALMFKISDIAAGDFTDVESFIGISRLGTTNRVPIIDYVNSGSGSVVEN